MFADWKAEIDELARCPNVVAKLGGLNMEVNGYGWDERPQPPTSAELADATRRYFEHTIERFGPSRCMFESNFPVDKLSLQLHGALELVQASVERLFGQRARRDVP